MTELHSIDNTKLYVSQIIDNLSDLAQYFEADTEEVVNYAQRHFRAKHRQNEWLTVRAMLRQALGPDVRIDYDESGKPFLVSNSSLIVPSYNFLSISHSKTHAALLLSSQRNIGVDIEQISPRVLHLAGRIAQPQELPADFQSFTPAQQAMVLTTIWTIKEAVYKSIDHQQGFDLLTDVQVIPQQSFDLPAAMEVSVKKILAKTRIHCSLYSDNIISVSSPEE